MRTVRVPEHRLVVFYDAAADLCRIAEPIASYTVKKTNQQAVWRIDNQSGKDIIVSIGDLIDKTTQQPGTPFSLLPPYRVHAPGQLKRIPIDLADDAPVTTFCYIIEVSYDHAGVTRTWRSQDPDLIIDGSAATPPGRKKKAAAKAKAVKKSGRTAKKAAAKKPVRKVVKKAAKKTARKR